MFNNFDKQFRETFQANVQDLYKNIEEQGKGVVDNNFRTFFNELEFQAKPEDMTVVDPLTLSPK